MKSREPTHNKNMGMNSSTKPATQRKQKYINDDAAGALLAAILNSEPLTVEQAIYKYRYGHLYGCKLTEQDTEDMIAMRNSGKRLDDEGNEITGIMSWTEIGEIYGLCAASVLRRIEQYYFKHYNDKNREAKNITIAQRVKHCLMAQQKENKVV